MTVVIEQPARARGVARAVPALGMRWQLALPAVLTLALAFRAGGFFLGTTALLAVLLAVALVGRVTLGRSPFAGWSPALAGAAGALGLLAAWTLLSALWSDAPFRALSEFDRTLAYTLALCLVGSFATRRGDLDHALRAVAAAFVVIAAAALVVRLFPETFVTDPGKEPSRLAFPLTYWNAMGVACAIGVVLALHCTSGARQGLVARVLGAGALPVLATTLYLTFSRGGIAAALLGVLLYVLLAHPRRLPLALLSAGIPTFFALRETYRSDSLAAGGFVTAEATHVAVAIAICCLAAMVLRALCVVVDRRLDAFVVSRRARRTALLGSAVALGGALLFTVLATEVPERVDDQRREFFEARGIGATGDQRDRLSESGANGRIGHWNVALDAFRAHPSTGTGAGTFRLEWERERESTMNVVDAHSLYLEALAELGWPGLLLLGVALLLPLGVALRRLWGPDRHVHAAFLAASLALLVHAGIDWDWEMPALFVWFFTTAAIVCAAPASKTRMPPPPGRIARVVAGLGCLFLAVAPAAAMASQSGLDRATRAFREADCATAVDGALDSLGTLRVRPEPYELLGYCNLRARQFPLALAAMQAAHRRDPSNWEYAYGLAVAQALDGEDPRPAAALALRLNPRDVRAEELHSAFARGGPRRWARAAARARVPFQ